MLFHYYIFNIWCFLENNKAGSLIRKKLPLETMILIKYLCGSPIKKRLMLKWDYDKSVIMWTKQLN